MLVVAPAPVFTPRGTPFSVYQRLTVAAELGVEAELLTYDEGADPDITGLRISRIPRIPFLRPVKVGPSLGKLARDILMTIWTIGILVKRPVDVVHAHEEAVFWCRALKPIFGFMLIYDMHSSLPQQLENFEYTSSAIVTDVFERLEDSALAAADGVLTISPALAALAQSKMKDPTRHVLLENSLMDPVHLRGAVGLNGALGDGGGERLVEAWPAEWPDSSVILYAGTLESYQGIDLLLDAFQHVVEVRPEARLVLIGGSERQVEFFRRHAESLGIAEACRFTGTIDQGVVRSALPRAGVLVSPRTRGTNTPLKVYELLDSGVPFVATRVESHTQILDDSVCVLAEPTPAAYAAGILRAMEGGEDVRAGAERARRLYEANYSRAAYTAKYRGLLERVGEV